MAKMINKCRFGTLAAIILTGLIMFGCGGGGGSSSSGTGSGGGTGGGGGGGTTTGPEITLSASQILFGNVVANTQGLRSADRSVQVTNIGTANLSIGQVAQADPLSAPFTKIGDTCTGATLAPNASCTVLVRFTPTAPGAYGPDTFDIPSNDADEPSILVSVSGNGQGLNVTINKVDPLTPPDTTVRMIVSVTDGDNNPITNLLAGDFSVTEEGVAKLFNVTNTGTVPVSVALNLDYSTSVAGFQTTIEDTAIGFLNTLQDPNDEAAVTKFARDLLVVYPLQQVTLADYVAPITNANFTLQDASKIYDAAFGSVDTLGAGATNDRLAALVVSDGSDFDNQTNAQASTHTLNEVIDNANAKQVFIFTIGLGTNIDAQSLQLMAVGTGGQYFEAPSAADLAGIYNQISAILTNQYAITFQAGQPVGSIVDLVVTATAGGLDGEDTETVTY